MKRLHLILVAVVIGLLAIPANATTTKTGDAVLMTADADTVTIGYGRKITGVKVINPTAAKTYRLLNGTTAGSGGQVYKCYNLTTSASLTMDPINLRIYGGGVNLDTDDTSTDFQFMLWLE